LLVVALGEIETWKFNTKQPNFTIDHVNELMEIEEGSLENEHSEASAKSYGDCYVYSIDLNTLKSEEDYIEDIDGFSEKLFKSIKIKKNEEGQDSFFRKRAKTDFDIRKSAFLPEKQSSNYQITLIGNIRFLKKVTEIIFEPCSSRTLKPTRTFSKMGNPGFRRSILSIKDEDNEPSERVLHNEDKLVLKKDVDIELSSANDVLTNYFTFGYKDDHALILPYDVAREVIVTPYTDFNEEDAKENSKKEFIMRNILKRKKRSKKRKQGVGDKEKGVAGRTSTTTKTTSHTTVESDNTSEFIDDLTNYEDNKDNEQVKEHLVVPIPELLEKMRNEITYDVKCTVPWSGQEVMPEKDRIYADYYTYCINKIRVWRMKYKGKYEKFHFAVAKFTNSTPMFWFFVLYSLCNNILLAMNRHGQPATEAKITNQMTLVFTYISFGEVALKIFSSGLLGFLSDPLNCVSGVIAIINFLDIVFFKSKSSYTRSFQVFHALKTFRVTRMLRMLKPIHSMKLIIRVIAEAIVVYAYIALFIILFLCIYALFGMQLFGGQFNFPEGIPQQNFDSFFNSFLSAFQVLCFQKWNVLLYSSLRARHPAIALTYYLSWLIIGSYILQNLFLAFLLCMFIEDEDEMGRDEDSDVHFTFTL
jgi:hypothetical protein